MHPLPLKSISICDSHRDAGITTQDKSHLLSPSKSSSPSFLLPPETLKQIPLPLSLPSSLLPNPLFSTLSAFVSNEMKFSFQEPHFTNPTLPSCTLCKGASHMMLVVKSLPAKAGDLRDVASIPELGRFPRRRAWEPTPVFLPGESHGQRSLAGYSPWDHKESDTTEVTQHTCSRHTLILCRNLFPTCQSFKYRSRQVMLVAQRAPSPWP